jgi:hypothetical protein
MWGCTFISKKFFRQTISLWFFSFALLSALAYTPAAQAQVQDALANQPSNASDANAPAVPAAKKDESNGLFDQSSPYLQYGDFNMDEDEDSDTQYFQYGRFFGLSLGLGYESATGDRGELYQPAFPRVDIRMHYWFDFNFAMDLGIYFANHQYTVGSSTTSVKLIGYGIDFKYYFETANSASAITFANPYLLIGVGAISKTQSSATDANPDTDSTLSVSVGAGLEFPIVYKKTYFSLEARYSTESFSDATTVDQSITTARGLTDLSGGFFSAIGQFMFVW